MAGNHDQVDRQLQLAERYKPLLVLYPEISAASRDHARNKNWRESANPPITQDYHPRDVRLILDHAWMGIRSQHDGDLLLAQMDRNGSKRRIKYHRGMPTPDKSWKNYRDIVAKQGTHRRENYPHQTYVHFAYADSQSRYAGLTAIQYWFIYYYNDWKTSHAGDWEHIVVFLRESPDNQAADSRPIACAYSAHHGGYRLAWEHVERVNDLSEPDDSDKATHPVVYVANGSHANYFFGPSRYATTTEVLGARVTSDQLPFSGEFTDFTESFERGIRIFPEVKVVPPPVNGSWEGEWRWLNFRGKWGSQEMSKLNYYLGLVLRRRPIGDAPGSLPERNNWNNPFEWADRECIDPLPPMDNWLTNEYYLRL